MGDDLMPEVKLAGEIDRELGGGYITSEKANAVAVAIPGVEGGILHLLRWLAMSRDWNRFVLYANLAVHLHPDGLGEVISKALGAEGFNGVGEDLVDILGELNYEPGVPVVLQYLKRSIPGDSPYYSISEKCVHVLGELNSLDAKKALRELTSNSWPDPIRWHAAVELEIEDDLGFDEAIMLRYP